MLLDKLVKAAQKSGIAIIALTGRVAANNYNSSKRKQLKELAEEYHWTIFKPDISYCTENAAMVAIADYYKYKLKAFANLTTKSFPNYPLT